MMLRFAAASVALLASGAIAMAGSASPVDGQFAFKASVGNSFEIQSSRMALKTSGDPQVRAYARRMIADHAKAQQGLARAAAASGAEAGDFLDQPHEAKLTELSGLTGAEFDQAYVAEQVEAHHETLQLLDDVAAAGFDPALAGWAAKTRPVVVMHLNMLGRMPAASSM